MKAAREHRLTIVSLLTDESLQMCGVQTKVEGVMPLGPAHYSSVAQR